MKICAKTKSCCSACLNATGRFALWNGRMVCNILDISAFILIKPYERIFTLFFKIIWGLIRFIYGIEEPKTKRIKKKRKSFLVIHTQTIVIQGDKIEVRKNSTPRLTCVDPMSFARRSPNESPATINKQGERTPSDSELIQHLSEAELKMLASSEPKPKKMTHSKSDTNLSKMYQQGMQQVGPPPYQDRKDGGNDNKENTAEKPKKEETAQKKGFLGLW